MFWTVVVRFKILNLIIVDFMENVKWWFLRRPHNVIATNYNNCISNLANRIEGLKLLPLKINILIESLRWSDVYHLKFDRTVILECQYQEQIFDLL